MIIRIFGILLLFASFMHATPSTTLDQYIRQGLENNLALRQQKFSLEKSLEALKEAKGMFFPSISLQGSYSHAGGGRTIEFPVGDLLNPVHGSLNDLFLFHGIIGGYPTDIPNEQIPFLRPKEQETKIRLVPAPDRIYRHPTGSHRIDLRPADHRIHIFLYRFYRIDELGRYCRQQLHHPGRLHQQTL